jgi:uncharacterized protein with PQ loop repeat
MIQTLGYIATFFVSAAALPQTIKAVREGHSRGVSGVFLSMLMVGFILMSLYLCLTKPVYPVLINYVINMVLMGIVSYYKLFPRN